MGKDGEKKSLYMTKDKLKSENLRLCLKLKHLESEYKDVNGAIVLLKRDYEMSKGMFPVQRYEHLKDMIKRTTTDAILNKAESFIEKDKPKTTSGLGGLVQHCKRLANSSSGEHEMATDKQPVGAVGGMLSSCKKFAGQSDDLEHVPEMKKDLSKMSKQEVSEDNDRLRTEIDKYPGRFLRGFNRLEKMKRDYLQSKQVFFVRRYSVMKTMIKTLANDSKLIPD